VPGTQIRQLLTWPPGDDYLAAGFDLLCFVQIVAF
jgi:hypothetical protein